MENIFSLVNYFQSKINIQSLNLSHAKRDVSDKNKDTVDNVDEDNLYVCFDLYILNNEIRSEWGKYPPNDIPIGLYAGNSCMSTTRFKLVIYINYSVMNDCDKYKNVFKLINGSKYETCNEKEFDDHC